MIETNQFLVDGYYHIERTTRRGKESSEPFDTISICSRGIMRVYDKKDRISYGGMISYKTDFVEMTNPEQAFLRLQQHKNLDCSLWGLIQRFNQGPFEIVLGDGSIETERFRIDFDYKRWGVEHDSEHMGITTSWHYRGMASVYDKQKKISYAGRLFSPEEPEKDLFSIGYDQQETYLSQVFVDDLIKDEIIEKLVGIFNESERGGAFLNHGGDVSILSFTGGASASIYS